MHQIPIPGELIAIQMACSNIAPPHQHPAVLTRADPGTRQIAGGLPRPAISRRRMQRLSLLLGAFCDAGPCRRTHGRLAHLRPRSPGSHSRCPRRNRLRVAAQFRNCPLRCRAAGPAIPNEEDAQNASPASPGQVRPVLIRQIPCGHTFSEWRSRLFLDAPTGTPALVPHPRAEQWILHTRPACSSPCRQPPNASPLRLPPSPASVAASRPIAPQ